MTQRNEFDVDKKKTKKGKIVEETIGLAFVQGLVLGRVIGYILARENLRDGN